MVMITNSRDQISGEDVRMTLNILQKHLSQYDLRDKYIHSKEDLMRNRRIDELVMQEKYLSQQFHRIRKEIRRYEKKYEKILKKKVELMGIQVKADLFILNTLKQKCNELNTHLNKNLHKKPEEEKEKEKENSKRTCKVHRMKRGHRFGHKSMPFNKKIKIKIKRNEKLGRREMLFVNDVNVARPITKLVNVAKPAVVNTRECKIMLERLSEEQMNRFIQQPTTQQENQQTSTDSLQKNNENETATDKPHWHIKIPKSVFEEIQKEDQSYALKATPMIKNITPTIRNITRVM